MQRTAILPITEFAPDAREWDSPYLELADNLLPVYGGWRSIPTYDIKGTGAIANEYVTGGYTHLITLGQLDEVLTPSSIDDNTLDDELVDTSTNNYGGSVSDDNTFMKYRQGAQVVGGTALILLSDPFHAEDAAGDFTLYVRFRTTSGLTNWSFDAKLQEFDGVATWADVVDTATGLVTLEIATVSSATPDTAWQTAKFTMTGPAYTDADDLRVVIEPTSTDTFDWSYPQPLSDEEINGNWLNQAGGTVLYTSIDDAYASWGAGIDGTYIDSPGLPVATEDTENYIIIRFPAAAPEINDDVDEEFEDIRVRLKHTGSSGDCTLWIQPWNVETDSPMLKANGTEMGATSFAVTTSFTEVVETFSDSYNSEDDKESLGLKIWAENVDAAAAASTDNYPASSGPNPDGWTFTGGGGLHGALGNNSNVVSKTTKLKLKSFSVNFGAITEPDDHNQTYLKVLCRAGGGGLKFENTSGAGGLGNFSTSNSGYQWKVIKLSPSKSENLDWAGPLTIKVSTRDNTGSEKTYDIKEMYLEVPGNQVKIRISALTYAEPALQGFDISWIALAIPAATATSPSAGDLNRVFFGTKSTMFMYEDTTTVTALTGGPGGGFGQGTYPHSWDFTSFGGDVYMTNYSDRPYKWVPGTPGAVAVAHTAGDIADTSGTIADFKYKFVESVGDHLVVANINNVDYETYTVCFSHFNDPNSFSAGDIGNQSDFQNLTQTPGEITGLIGGEYGLVFKRNSIYRMSYVGPDVIFRFDLISRSIGTPYGKSIVSVGPDVYFYTDSGFYVMRNGGYPERIGDGKVTKAITDTQHGIQPVSQPTSTLPSSNDNNIVGTWDPVTGLIWWIYIKAGTLYDDIRERYLHTNFITYNPSEDRWGASTLLDLYVSETGDPPIGDQYTGDVLTYFNGIASLKNPGVNTDQMTRGVVLFLTNLTSRTVSDGVQVATLTSSRVTSSLIRTKRLSAKAVGLETNKRFKIQAVRPIIWGTPTADFDPAITLTIRSFSTPTIDDEIDSTVATNANIGDDGWYELDPISCEYFDIQMEYDFSFDEWTSKDIGAFEVRIDDSGEY
jgi:hypothetical protein